MSNKPYTQSHVLANTDELLQHKERLKQHPNIRIIEPLGSLSSIFISKPYPIDYFPTVWIISPGGSGTSLLHSNLAPVVPYPTLKSHSNYFKWDHKSCIMSANEGGYMWEIEKNDKIIYLYAHPLNILLSFHKKIELTPDSWSSGKYHYIELLCETNEEFMDHYLYKDVLNLERHIDGWWHQRDFDILCIKYEHIYEHLDDIAAFVKGKGHHEINFRLPLKRERSTDWRTHPQKELLLKTYASVIEKYEQRPEYELFLGENKNVF